MHTEVDRHAPGDPPFELKSHADGTLAVEEPWDAEQVFAGEVNDVSGMAFDPSDGTLLIVSQESSRVIRVDPGSGAVLDSLALKDTTTSEGIALLDGCRMAVVSEPDLVRIYAPSGGT